MIETACTCGQPATLPEASVPSTLPCPACKTALHFVSAEPLPPGTGTGDFDACLVVERGPHHDRVGHVYFLGGVPDITLGKLSTSHILLPGSNVSRHHATLSRLDFGPSRWHVADRESANGLWVNGDRVTDPRELVEGDVLTVGDYDLKFHMAAVPAMAAAAAAPPIAAPSRAAPPPRPPAGRTRPVPYARPGATRPGDDHLPLGDADPAWVLTLRNASHLLVSSVACSILGTCAGGTDSAIGMLLSIAGALLGFFGAWMLSAREPGAPPVPTAILLRVAASINVAGNLLTLVGTRADQRAILSTGVLLGLAAVPQTFLLLWTLRRLATRLPNPGLAANALIVMIGLPASLFVLTGGLVMAVLTHSTALAVLGGVSAIAFLAFSLWYIVLLVWFNRSFS